MLKGRAITARQLLQLGIPDSSRSDNHSDDGVEGDYDYVVAKSSVLDVGEGIGFGEFSKTELTSSHDCLR